MQHVADLQRSASEGGTQAQLDCYGLGKQH